MAKKKRQRISYVLPLASTPGGHRLGVNGLAYDQDRSILYTGGRDGVICAWDLDIAAQNSSTSEPNEKKSTTRFRKQVQAHTHWVNDIVLVKNNLGLVSASSDVTVKLWRPHGHDAAATVANTIGSHSDYIKCLASPGPTANWVASGGLDHRICLWDLSGAGKTLEINVGKSEKVVKGSVYALHAKESILASGGPESVVRLWDVKSGKSITKLVGHTDNVRDILMSDDCDTLLTASSDETIKVWSITAGRCLHTLTMHNDSVWCMHSNDPSLSVFYSGDRSGLVAKTDTRQAMEVEEGVSVAICQEHDGVARVVTAGESVWTATSSSSVNRWKDVETDLEVETPPPSPRKERSQSVVSKSIHEYSPPATPPAPLTNGVHATPRIPHNAVLKMANTAVHPGRKHTTRISNRSATNLRKMSEAIVIAGDNLSIVVPIRGQPAETIEGQNGLVKHVMLNDRKRILTLDTAGEVVLWDLLKCIPIKSFGRRHLDEVVPQVNTTESVANWCTVDTKTGNITVQLEENYCFDAEVYADEIDIPERIEFRDDQRINLGKWVLRNLFTTLLDEEIRRDEIYRRTFRTEGTATNRLQRPNAPQTILLPDSVMGTPMISPGTLITPRAINGHPIVTPTAGMMIGAATPHIGPTSSHGNGPLTTTLSPTLEEGTNLEKRPSQSSRPSTGTEQSRDYFTTANATNSQSETSSENTKPLVIPATPSETVPTSPPQSPTEERKKGTLFGKKFQMNFPKKLARTSAEVKSPTVATEEKSDTASNKSSSEKDEKVIEDNFLGVVQKIRQEYDDHVEVKPNDPVPVGITPSPPMETPMLKPPLHTVVIVQEDNPESGGLADQYRGTIGTLGQEADMLEKIAPMWLGELLLKNQIPYKDTVKVSFVLHPFEDQLPSIASPDGNARLNAHRMLRAKKILAYVAERIEAPPPPPAPQPASPTSTHPTSMHAQTTSPSASEVNTPAEHPAVPMKPEEYLDLFCQGQRIDPNVTLGTLRVHIWRTGGDIVLYYKANGRKALKLPHPADVPMEEQSRDTTGVAR